MYKYFGIALLGIFATMLIPISAESSTGPTFYGIAHVTTFDSTGNPTSTQTVHNALIDLGEKYVVEQLFQETSAVAIADNAQIATICLSEDATYAGSGTTPVETTSVATFDGADGMTITDNCLEDTAVDVSASGIAIIDGGVTFDAGTHADQDQAVTNIGICPAYTAANLGNGCAATAGGSNLILFAIVDITDFTLGVGESATITYTFDVAE